MNKGQGHHRTRLTAEDVLTIRRMYRAGFSISKIAREYGYGPSGIIDIVNYNTWKDVKEPEKQAQRYGPDGNPDTLYLVRAFYPHILAYLENVSE